MGFAENDEIKKARAALDEVNEAIRAYEKEKSRLESEVSNIVLPQLEISNPSNN
jgi:hypothetical protein